MTACPPVPEVIALKTPPKGLYCPQCFGTWLKVLTTRRPCPGVRIRYRGCVECGTRVKTREVMLVRRPKPPSVLPA